jgi:hypothetical protein
MFVYCTYIKKGDMIDTTDKKVLEIIKDCTIHTSYATMNSPITRFFEGGKSPLRDAKKWAKENGYTHVKLISTRISQKNKLYIL